MEEENKFPGRRSRSILGFKFNYTQVQIVCFYFFFFCLLPPKVSSLSLYLVFISRIILLLLLLVSLKFLLLQYRIQSRLTVSYSLRLRWMRRAEEKKRSGGGGHEMMMMMKELFAIIRDYSDRIVYIGLFVCLLPHPHHPIPRLVSCVSSSYLNLMM